MISNTLAPKHRIASEPEVAELLATLGTTIDRLPVIIITDPALNGLGAKVGDVIRIDRFSAVTKKVEPYYRVVVE